MSLFTHQRSLFLVPLLVCSASLGTAQNILAQGLTPAPVAQRTLVLTNATLIDGAGGPDRAGMTLVVTEGRVSAIGASAPSDVPDGAQVVDLGGRIVLPGLGEGHTHLATNPSAAGYRERVERQLRTLLGHGITHVRDLGGDGRVLSYLARQTSLGELAGPDIHYSALLAGPDYFRDPRIQAASKGATVGTTPWAQAVTADTNLNDVMAQVVGVGAAGVKVYANVAPDLLRRIVDAAHARGLSVWSHWVVRPGQTRAIDAVRAGVDVVSHAYMPMLDAPPEARAATATVLAVEGPTLFQEMRERGTVLDPTLVAAAGLPTRPGWITPEAFSLDVITTARKAGVPIVAGSDHGDDTSLPGIHLEFRALERDAGMTARDVIVSASSVSARVAGIAATDGVLAVGKHATLLILDTDVLDTVETLAAPLFVMKRGVIYSGPDLRDVTKPVAPLDAVPTLPSLSRRSR